MATDGDGADAIFCVAETTAGRVQGLVNGGIRRFCNVPYGAPAGGGNRFMPPRKPTPWTGVRECFGYGQVAPQIATDVANSYGALIQFDLLPALGGMGEDCLHLNIWTPGLNDNAKRAVLVSFHGGGFAIGSSNAAMYDGTQLSRLGDVVVVCVNHRLGSFGYVDLIDAGAPEEFSSAGVVGLMDLVAALQWVRENIASFGGDPGRVMIFGQSGGGWKTSSILATPAAKGLFHRAAVQSGSWLRFQTREEAAQVSSAFIAKLGLTKNNIADIRKLSWQTLLAAQTAIGAHAFTPVLDRHYLLHHPCDPTAPEESAHIPLIISTTTEDAGLFFDNFDLDEAGLHALLRARYSDKTDAMLRLYRNIWPDKSPFLLHAQIVTDSGFRYFARIHAERKVAQGRAPVYCYQWAWPSPAFDGRFGAAHAMDVSASFYNVRDAIVGTGSRAGVSLCRQLASAWIAFAKSGNPNNPDTAHWPSFDLVDRPTLMIDDHICVVNDPYPVIREFWNGMPRPLSVFG